MSSISISMKDLRIFFKNRNLVLTTFLLPVLFILAFMLVANATVGSGEENLIPLPVVNLDPDGAMAAELLASLDAAGGVKTESYDQAEAETMIEAEDIKRYLIIPAGFSDDLAAGNNTELRLINNSSNAEETEAVVLVIEGVARGMSVERQLIASLEQMGQMQAADPDAGAVFTADKAIAQARSQFEGSKTRPLISVEESIPQAIADRVDIELNSTQLLVPGWTVLFVFLIASTTARSIHDEKKIGSFRRLMAAPISKGSLLTGKLLPNFLIVILQVVFVFAIAMYVFPLLGIDPLTLGNAPVALALLILVLALCSTTVGITIAGLARTEAQISGIGTVILWIMGFLGGAIIPFYLMGGAFDIIGRFTPHYWALIGFNDLLVRGQDLSGIWQSLLALLGFSLLFFVIGLWRFDFE